MDSDTNSSRTNWNFSSTSTCVTGNCPTRIESIRRALAIGVKVVAGTDAGGHGHPANAGELECLVKSGMTPMQALQAATGWAAECLGQEADLGTVEPGKLADLVVVAGDPLADIGVLCDPQRIALVVKDGQVAANRISP